MQPKLALPVTATFSTYGPCVTLPDGGQICVESKLALLEGGFCNVTSRDRKLAEALMDVRHPEEPSIRLCGDLRLVELAARYWIWANTGENHPWADTTVPILESTEEARKACFRHVEHIHRMCEPEEEA